MATKKRKAKASPYMDRKPVNFEAISCWVYPEQKKALKALSERTKIPQQALLREAIDNLIAKYRSTPGPK